MPPCKSYRWCSFTFFKGLNFLCMELMQFIAKTSEITVIVRCNRERRDLSYRDLDRECQLIMDSPPSEYDITIELDARRSNKSFRLLPFGKLSAISSRNFRCNPLVRTAFFTVFCPWQASVKIELLSIIIEMLEGMIKGQIDVEDYLEISPLTYNIFLIKQKEENGIPLIDQEMGKLYQLNSFLIEEAKEEQKGAGAVNYDFTLNPKGLQKEIQSALKEVQEVEGLPAKATDVYLKLKALRADVMKMIDLSNDPLSQSQSQSADYITAVQSALEQGEAVVIGLHHLMNEQTFQNALRQPNLSISERLAQLRVVDQPPASTNNNNNQEKQESDPVDEEEVFN
ncbi:hypothetical protein FGO68_gene11591 [Halteria grandinella]|uniref:Uncharacterized protein n=1 Tax=Halteria grandinella TaxID=5974 RepID=A0A8J8T1K6_HALGN|nr:hypothetical protein FGO68_gene11591 [Halteria grandinella]